MFGRKSKAKESATEKHAETIETAWRIHAALGEWTSKVDAKASFAVALESAGVATVVALSDDKKIYSGIEGPWQGALYYGGLLALLAATSFAVWVVVPRLRAKHVAKEWPDNFIYFGHLKFWDPVKLPDAIKRRDLLPVLTQQMVKMSEIAWKKHVAVKVSMYLALTGGGALVVCAFMVRFGVTI